MTLPFNEAKATEFAARLLSLRNAPMSYTKLIKLMYLADRESLVESGRPISTDRYTLTETGPILNRVHELITVGSMVPSIWAGYISDPIGDREVESRPRQCSIGELSEAEEATILKIFQEHGRKTRWAVNEYARLLPECLDSRGAVIELEYADILRAAGKSPSQVLAITQELESLAHVIIAVEPLRSDGSVVL